MGEVTSLWVFGYGSLVWKPGFQPGQTAIGYVEGLARKFWQGNETHRGVPGKPGRVATLVEEKQAITHGVALELKGEEALDYLNNREMTLGGYIQEFVTFHPTHKEIPPFPVLVFIATPQSKHWLGPTCESLIAKQVVDSCGPSGHNVEYVVKLAMWLRETFPKVWDDHLYTIETYIMLEIQKQSLRLEDLMGNEDVNISSQSAQNQTPMAVAAAPRPASFLSCCPHKSLRCVKL